MCDALLNAIKKMENDDVPLSLKNKFHGFQTARFYDLLNYAPIWQELVTHPLLLNTMRGVLGPDCLLNTYGTSIIGPGERAQPIHVDDGPFISAPNATPLRHRGFNSKEGARESIVVNTIIALCDFTEDMGATRYLPDSHKLPYPRPEELEELMQKSKPAVMPKGSIFFFDGQCYHAGGTNATTDTRRYAISADFCAGYLRTQENFILSIPRSRIERFSTDLQEIIGFKISRGGLGHVYNHQPTGAMTKVAMRNSATYYDKHDAGNGVSTQNSRL